ncbi:MAG: hypothetical protein LBQ55_02230, partial [Treponema sp.]|nr:hypothetical protein [Treponema sp.]
MSKSIPEDPADRTGAILPQPNMVNTVNKTSILSKQVLNFMLPSCSKKRTLIRATLINLTLISIALLFFSFSCGKLRKTTLKYALIYSRLN